MICEICGSEFRPRKRADRVARFCSKGCRMAAMTRPIEERFWEKVDRRSPTECWLWTGATTYGGYGVIGLGRRLVRAHRYAYEASNGPIDARLVIRHKCDTPACVNPDHLEIGTQKQNVGDMLDRGRANPRRKLTPVQLAQIKAATGTVRSIAVEFGVSNSYVSMVKTGRRSIGRP